MSVRRLSPTPVLVALALVLLMLLPDGAHAQSFDSVFSGVLSGSSSNCSPLSSNLLPGGKLQQLCNSIPVGSPSGGGSVTLDNRNTDTSEQRLLRRLQERREQKRGASADDGSAIRGLSVFGSADYQWADKGITEFEPAWERDTYGGTIGADYLLGGGKFLVGAAFSYLHQTTIFGRNAGNVEIDGYGPTIYASFFPKDNIFVDGYFGYMRRDYSTERRFDVRLPGFGIVGTSHGDTDSNEFKAGLNSGIDFYIGKLTIGPRLGIDFKENQIAGYTETGGTGLELIFDSQTQQSLTSKLGVFASWALSMGWGVLVPQGTLEWRHEFKDNQRTMFFSFVEDLSGQKFAFQSDKPDRDYFNASLGVVALLPNGLAPFLNVRQLFGYTAQSSTTVTAGLRVAF